MTRRILSLFVTFEPDGAAEEHKSSVAFAVTVLAIACVLTYFNPPEPWRYAIFMCPLFAIFELRTSYGWKGYVFGFAGYALAVAIGVQLRHVLAR